MGNRGPQKTARVPASQVPEWRDGVLEILRDAKVSVGKFCGLQADDVQMRADLGVPRVFLRFDDRWPRKALDLARRGDSLPVDLATELVWELKNNEHTADAFARSRVAQKWAHELPCWWPDARIHYLVELGIDYQGRDLDMLRKSAHLNRREVRSSVEELRSKGIISRSNVAIAERILLERLRRRGLCC
jgi:hypothetical protein